MTTFNTSRFLRDDGTLDEDVAPAWSGWLPAWSQIAAALRLEFDAPEPPGRPFGADDSAAVPAPSVWDISMRQGLGLVVVAGLLAGILPFVVNWVSAARGGGVLPLVEAARAVEGARSGPLSPIWSALQDLGGLEPAFFPRWLAACLSALGAWLNLPLSWLSWWIAYGTAVLLAAKAWGVGTTLQRFFALTGYAAVPLVLTGLGPIPWLGGLAQLAGTLWMLVLYVRAVSAATGLDFGRAVIATLAPGALLGLLGTLTVVSMLATVLRILTV